MICNGKMLVIAMSATALSLAAVKVASQNNELIHARLVNNVPVNINTDLVKVCKELTLYYTQTTPSISDVIAECSTENGVFMLTEQNPSSDYIDPDFTLPAFYKGVEIMSDIEVARIRLDSAGGAVMSFETTPFQTHIQEMVDNGSFSKQIEPLLVRMKLAQ